MTPPKPRRFAPTPSGVYSLLGYVTAVMSRTGGIMKAARFHEESGCGFVQMQDGDVDRWYVIAATPLTTTPDEYIASLERVYAAGRRAA